MENIQITQGMPMPEAKEINTWGGGKFEPHDYLMATELTVTITLNEYRTLVSATAKANLEMERTKAEYNAQMVALKAENERLGIKLELLTGNKAQEDKA